VTVAHPRLTREQSRARTRERLLDAAGRVFARRGFHGASVEEVAEEAGHSKGAVYSNFTSKEDLFLTLLEQRCAQSIDRIATAFATEGSIEDRIARGAELLSCMVQEDRDDSLLFVELWTYAARDAEVARRMAAMYEENRRRIAAVVAAQADEVGLALPAPAADIAAALVALNDGLVLQALVDHERFPPHSVSNLLLLVLSGFASLGAAAYPTTSAPAGPAPRPSSRRARTPRR